MSPSEGSIEQFVRDQVEKWKQRHKESRAQRPLYGVITLSTQPGSYGRKIADQLARQLNYDLFDRDIIQSIAKSAKTSSQVVNTLEKERLSGVEDFLSSLVKEKYLHPGTYLRHLMRVIGIISKHGQAVIVGRGANFIIPSDQRFSVRVVAPLELRISRIGREFDTTMEEAKKRVLSRESRRRAYIRESFNADISDPLNYDLVINSEKVSVQTAVETILTAGRPG